MYESNMANKRVETQGNQERKKLTLADQLEANKKNRQSARSRTMARSF